MRTPTAIRPNAAQHLIIAWGLGGVLLLLGQAIWRLAPWAMEAMAEGLTWWQWALLVIWVAFSCYAEGHRGFHKQFSPRVVGRAHHLARHPRALHVVFAMPFCMSFYHASRKGLIRSWGLVAAILCLIVLVRLTPQPWRGIIDAGVVMGLLWGALSVVFHWLRSIRHGPQEPTDLPTHSPTTSPATNG